MSLKIVKAGILDTVQDLGRHGYQHLGINPGGVMDQFAAPIANMLVGNDVNEAMIELHFPAATFFFEESAIISICGADFSATLNGEPIPLWHPVIISKNSVLQFRHWKKGARCYLAIREKLDIPKWLGSYSTHLKAGVGGYKGRALQKDDVIGLKEEHDYKKILGEKDHFVLPWEADTGWMPFSKTKLTVLAGPEWNWLSASSQVHFVNDFFEIKASADRMGYRLQSNFSGRKDASLISAPVGFGTVQLLPNGELIVLMADHQATGGYPRIAHVVTAHLSVLSQLPPGEELSFGMADHEYAEELLIHQQQHLLQLENACKFRLDDFLGGF
jgi:antagonist of KipI